MFRVLRTAVLVAVIALSGFAAVRVAVEQKRQEELRAGVAKVRPDGPGRDYRYERLNAPARTVVRDGNGAVVASFTDGARTAAITGPTRTFSEPARTPAVVTTPVWARLIPQPWRDGSEREEWFRPWLDAAVVDRSDDVLAIATQYLDDAPAAVDDKSVRYRGNASFGVADFYDYLGVSWSFAGGGTENPAKEQYGALDAAGFVRLVFGYRLGYPLRDGKAQGTGLPRTPAAMAGFDTGVPIIENTPSRLALQPGDLLFFDTGRGAVDHVGLFVGLDQSGRPRYVSSRRQSEGPTLGDDGTSFTGLRSARRL
jgi:cell wall-associated NlpC family hydrolase